MKKNIKLLAIATMGLAIITMIILYAGGLKGLDVVGQHSIISFDTVLKTIPDKVTADEINNGWSLVSPDNSVRFIWSEDYSQSPLHDVMLEMDARPFIEAGLDTSKLPENYTTIEDILVVGIKLGVNEKVSGISSAIASYKLIVQNYRESINYHTSLDHYGVMLGDGNMFEWAKNMTTNGYDKSNQDKDIVFVLNPAPLITAGVDPEKVDGWVYAQVPIEENGKPILVWKFLKPFDLK